MIRLIRAVSLLVMLLLGSHAIHAQVVTGTPPFSSSAGGPDRIDLANLNVHLDVPIINKPGRGMNFTYDMSYDSLVWFPVVAGSTTSWMPAANWGWRGQTEVATGYVTHTHTITAPTCPNPDYPPALPKLIRGVIYSNYWYHDSLGVGHPFDVTGTTVPCGGGGESGTATDGSGYVINLDTSGEGTATVTSPSGTLLNPPGGAGVGAATKTDRNGNQISVNGSGVFTDTLGTTALTIAGSGTATSPNTFSYTAPSGGTAKFTMNYTNYTVATNFGASGITEYRSTAAVPLVSSIVLPDGSQYSFTYEATPSVPSSGACTPYAGTTCTTARLASVTLPTGGTISYTYTGGSNGIFADGTTAGFKRYTPDTGGSAYWNYSRTQETGAASITTITDPTAQANQTLLQFQGLYETQRDIYQGAAPAFSTFPIPETTLQTAGLLKEIQICYNTNTTACTSTAIATPISQRNITTHLSGASSWASSKTSQSIFKYNSTGSLIEQDDYDYGSGSPGSLLKKTAITYASLTNIANFRQQVIVTDGTGATVSKINYNYGDTVTATSGTPQHTTPGSSRGNLLSVNHYTQGSTFLTKSYTYFDTGNIRTMTDVNGAQTTYTYGSTGCPNSFPTSVAEPLSLSRSMTWNCTGGVQTSAADENGKTNSTSFTTDPSFWRPESATDPTNAVASFTYASRTQTEAVLPIVNGSSGDKLVTLDSLGRSSLSQIRETPTGSTFDTVETDYDITGRPTRSTLPFAANGGQKSSTAPGSTTVYDPLARVTSITDGGTGSITNSFSQNDVIVTRGPAPTGENPKKHQSEYDALGRLVSVCEITSVGGSGTCSQSNPQTGFWTKYTYDPIGRLKGVTQNAQSSSTQSRSFVYDLMGRMTTETEAESGTTTYTYDTDSTCGTSSGDLVKKVDAVGNVTCYSYDALHRVLSKTYPSGSYASATPSKFFVYDSATVNGVAVVNAKGRLAEAYTCTGSCTSKITDEGFSYTARGQMSDQYQSSPNSSGYYHANYLYWPNGAVQQISGLPSLPTFTYGVDPEGRINTLSASTGQNPLTGTTYNSASLPTALNFGSGDSDAYTYDPNTDRLTKYQFNVNGQAFVGNLTWNANGTLGTLGITDPFNSADTQNCAYSYDDLMRIASANCGSTWTQTFSYDAFGNLFKSGTMSFQPTYSSSTNRMTSLPGFTPTYDANGNVLTNPDHTYTWDADGKYASVDGSGIIYDALNRMIEIGGPSEILYSPDGSQLLFKGQVARSAVLKLPGGSAVTYDSQNGGLINYAHADHLGSFRLVTTPTRSFVSSVAFAPFGEHYSGVNVGPYAEFTGQPERFAFDEYDFPARQFSTEGRWVSPDPSGPAAFHLTDPQSLNRYAYARNTPLSVVDPTGLYDEPDDDPLLFSVGPGGGADGDPTSGGSPDNSGGGCGPNDPACLGPLQMPGAGDPLNNPLASSGPGPGPGDQFSNIVDAGIFASIYAFWQTKNDQFGGEYGGEIYQNANGTYSFDAGRPSNQLLDINGNVLAEDADSVTINPGAIPDGTQFVADYHTHGFNFNPSVDDFSSTDRANTVFWSLSVSGYRGSFLSNTTGVVLYGGPTKETPVCQNCFGPPGPP